LRSKYRLDAVLGVGGMAVVYAVTHRNGRRFALKMLHAELSVRSDLRKRFLREGYIANAVGHTGAVAVLDDDIAEDGSAFLVMELLDGEGIDSLLSRHPDGIPTTAALSLTYQLLDVLAAAHAKNIIHRDIKPGNLFATRKGEIKVLDFGIARLQEPEGKATTRTGMTMGTPAFMAPEQAMGRPIDARADLFSVGATLFTLLSGRFVHQGDTGQELMVKAATEPAPHLASLAPHLPPAVAEFVDRALAFGLTERWQSADRMQAAVADVFQSLTGNEVSGADLAAIVTRSHAAEIYASVPEGPPAGAPRAPGESVRPPAQQPHTPTVAMPGAPPRPTSSHPSAPGVGMTNMPITGEPVASTRGNSSLGVTPPPTLPPKRTVRVAVGAALLGALVAAGIVLKLKSGTSPPTGTLPSAAAAVTTVTTATPPPAPLEIAPPGQQGAPGVTGGLSPDAREYGLAPTRTTTRTAAPQPTSPAPSRTATSAADAGAHHTEPTPKVDPWATP
jgi:serine/threonine-protein kinase